MGHCETFPDVVIVSKRKRQSFANWFLSLERANLVLLRTLVCEIPRRFERSSLSNFRTQGSFIHINSGKIFERDVVWSDSVAKSATQKPWVF